MEVKRLQCKKCPWKVGTNPHEIPDGYSEEKHIALRDTISEGLANVGKPLKIFACHETGPGAELPCVGWLANQLGPGNNLGLRCALMTGRIDGNVETVGPQHRRFEDTLP